MFFPIQNVISIIDPAGKLFCSCPVQQKGCLHIFFTKLFAPRQQCYQEFFSVEIPPAAVLNTNYNMHNIKGIRCHSESKNMVKFFTRTIIIIQTFVMSQSRLHSLCVQQKEKTLPLLFCRSSTLALLVVLRREVGCISGRAAGAGMNSQFLLAKDDSF